MPWNSFKRGDEWCNYKLDAEGNPTGEALGCFESPALAKEQLDALYASEKALDPSGYVYLSLANDPTVISVMRDVQAVLGADGIEWQAAPTLHITLIYAPNVDVATLQAIAQEIHVSGLMIVELMQLGIFENGESRALHIKCRPGEALKELQRRIYQAFAVRGIALSPYSAPEAWQAHITLAYLPPGIDVELFDVGLGAASDTVIVGCGEYEPIVEIYAPRFKSFSFAQIVKSDGDCRLMVLRSSNAYRDREDEILSTKALEGYVERAWNDADEFVGSTPLLLWHAGDPIGDIVGADMDGPFLIEVAQERPDALINIAGEGESPLRISIKAVWDALEQMSDLGASPAFWYELGDREDGVYDWIEKQETSVLPRWAAANWFTDAEVLRSAA